MKYWRQTMTPKRFTFSMKSSVNCWQVAILADALITFARRECGKARSVGATDAIRRADVVAFLIR